MKTVIMIATLEILCSWSWEWHPGGMSYLPSSPISGSRMQSDGGNFQHAQKLLVGCGGTCNFQGIKKQEAFKKRKGRIIHYFSGDLFTMTILCPERYRLFRGPNKHGVIKSGVHSHYTPSILKYKIFWFVLSQSSLNLTRFIEKNINN